MYKQKTLDFIEAKKKGSITLLLLKINLSKMIAKEKTEVLQYGCSLKTLSEKIYTQKATYCDSFICEMYRTGKSNP